MVSLRRRAFAAGVSLWLFVAATCTSVRPLNNHSSALRPNNANTTVHCAGQSPHAFAAYSEFMAIDYAAPAVFMTYCGLANLKASYFETLLEDLQNASSARKDFLIPQIGLALPQGDALKGVANGTYDAQIQVLVAGKFCLNPSHNPSE